MRNLAKTLTLGYVESEDRMWVRLGTDQQTAHQYQLSRRVLRQLLPQVWALLQRTLAKEALVGGITREDALMREHHTKIEREISLEASPPMDEESARERHPKAMEAAPTPEGLIQSINVSADEKSVKFGFVGPLLAIDFAGTRADGHRILQMLWKVQDGAGWDLAAPWDQPMVRPPSENVERQAN
jgi:hypothetical protein